jgi:hypothetical protein
MSPSFCTLDTAVKPLHVVHELQFEVHDVWHFPSQQFIKPEAQPHVLAVCPALAGALIVPVTANRVADTQPVDVFRAWA